MEEIKNYCSKRYEMKFMKFFKLFIFAEDRENGEYKIFVNINFLNKEICGITFRIGMCDDEKNIKGYYIHRKEKTSLVMNKQNTKIINEKYNDNNFISFISQNERDKIEIIVSSDLKEKFIENTF